MNKDTNDKQGLRSAEGPNVAVLIEQLQQSATYATEAQSAMLHAENIRFCQWAGQQADGRKPDLVNDRPAKPWGGASDTRQRLADELVVGQVRLMKKVSRSAKLTVRGTEGSDFAAAGKTQIYLDHLRAVRMRANTAIESELAAQWRQTYGMALTAVTWRQKWARTHDAITLEQLTALTQSGQLPAAAMLLALISSPERADLKEAVRLLQQIYPDLEQSEAYEQLQALKTGGKMMMPGRQLVDNRPEWQALKLWRDVFVPLNTGTDLQRAPWIAWRWTGTRAEVEEKALSDGWSEEFIATVRASEGSTLLEALNLGRTGSRQVFADRSEEMAGLHEVYYFYYEACGEDGLPCKYRTVISPHKIRADAEAVQHGPDGPAGYDHGLYPFVLHLRERPDRMAVESRGTPEIVQTNQQELKWQRDAAINQTDLALQPPVIRPEREIGLPLNIRPLGEIGQRRMQALQFQPVPALPPQSPGLEAAALRDAYRYFARNRAEDPVGASLADQDLADDWAAEQEQLWRLTLQTAQQFETELEFQRIVGGQPQPFKVAREEIQGAHDIQLFFNTEALDPERLQAKAEIMQRILLPLDRTGVIDWAPVVRGLFAYYLPEFADNALRSGDQATAAEAKDEANNWGLILSGTEPEMAEHGQNFALRLQWLQGKMQEPGAVARLGQLPDSQQLAQRRLEHLKFQLQQQENADTGRKGVAPLGGLSAAAR